VSLKIAKIGKTDKKISPSLGGFSKIERNHNKTGDISDIPNEINENRTKSTKPNEIDEWAKGATLLSDVAALLSDAATMHHELGVIIEKGDRGIVHGAPWPCSPDLTHGQI
jgi:hypothetical protein